MVTFRKVGRQLNAQWIVYQDGVQSGLTIRPDVIKDNEVRTYEVVDFRDGTGTVVAGSIMGLDFAQTKASRLLNDI
jgi:hypothetical protein